MDRRSRHPGHASRSLSQSGAGIACVLLACALVALPSGAGTKPGTELVFRPPCLDPADCRLSEAAAPRGIRIGLFDGVGHPERERIALAEANAFTNHGFSWNVIQPEPDVWDFRAADRGYAWAEEHYSHQTGLHFAWSQQLLDDLAGWVLEIDDPDALRAVLRNRARVIFARYPGLDRIDVINEPLDGVGRLYPNHFYEVLGPDYVHELFEIVADEAPAGLELFINENFVEYSAEKAAGLVALARELVAAGAPIHAVGLQTHLLFGEPDWDLYLATMQQLADLGVAVFVSELDVPVSSALESRLALQAERYRRVVETCLRVPACDEINVWGVDDPSSWLNWFLGPGTDPLLFDGDFSPKPAYFAMRDALLAPEPSSSLLALAAISTLASLRRRRRVRFSRSRGAPRTPRESSGR